MGFGGITVPEFVRKGWDLVRKNGTFCLKGQRKQAEVSGPGNRGIVYDVHVHRPHALIGQGDWLPGRIWSKAEIL